MIGRVRRGGASITDRVRRGGTSMTGRVRRARALAIGLLPSLHPRGQTCLENALKSEEHSWITALLIQALSFTAEEIEDQRSYMTLAESHMSPSPRRVVFMLLGDKNVSTSLFSPQASWFLP